ncbi:MAG: hypothetical protein ACT4QC_21470 [Planctomycetaceae bacterium]
MTQQLRSAAVDAASSRQCPECRGYRSFTVLSRDSRVSSKVTCPACRGTGVSKSPARAT